MGDVARRKGPARALEDMPEWMRALKGFGELKFKQFEPGSKEAEGEGILDGGTLEDKPALKGGAWRMAVVMPDNVAEAAERIDPVLLLPGLAGAVEEFEAKIAEVVRYCRAEGRTWTQIGEALSMSKQAAWERFSGEE
jgi:hypothetical protein